MATIRAPRLYVAALEAAEEALWALLSALEAVLLIVLRVDCIELSVPCMPLTVELNELSVLLTPLRVDDMLFTVDDMELTVLLSELSDEATPLIVEVAELRVLFMLCIELARAVILLDSELTSLSTVLTSEARAPTWPPTLVRSNSIVDMLELT
jgi:hypothetical protein